MRLGLTAVLAAGTLTSVAHPGEPVAFYLTVLHNNDAESQLVDAGSGSEDFGGAARFATLVQDLRAAAPTAPSGGSLLISGGDNFLAGPEFNASLTSGVPFFDTLAMELIGYDVAAIGNHEFDFGPDVLADFLSGFSIGSGPTFVSANLDFSNEPNVQAFVNSGRVASSTVINVDGTDIGIVGATTPNLPFISSPRDTIINDVATAVQAEIDALTMNGVNIILLTSHLQDVNEEIALVTQLSGIDAVIAGGGDELLANPGDLLIPGDSADDVYPLLSTSLDMVDVPVVSTPGDYRYVGRLVLGFDASGNLVDIDPSSGPVRVAGGMNPDAVAADPAVQAQVVDPVVAALAAQANNIVYSSNVGLNGVRDDIRAIETNLGNLIADAFLWQANELAPSFGLGTVDVAFANGGGIRNDSVIPAGDVSELTNFGILPFGNFLSVVPNIPPAQLKELLENAYSRVDRGIGGTGRYAQIAGMRIVVDYAQTPQDIDDMGNITQVGSRVRDITLSDGTKIVENGALVPGAPSVNLATADFTARGGDQFPFNGAPFTRLGVTYDLVLSNYVQDEMGGIIDVLAYPGGGENRIIGLGEPLPEAFCLADFDHSISRNMQDVMIFLDLYGIGSGAADMDANGRLNYGDVVEFLQLFATTCPAETVVP